jgi:hypothetical protein
MCWSCGVVSIVFARQSQIVLAAPRAALSRPGLAFRAAFH